MSPAKKDEYFVYSIIKIVLKIRSRITLNKAAVLNDLQQIAVSVSLLSSRTKALAPEVPWAELSGWVES